MARVVRVAHRGASATAPENTLAAFRQAVEHGVDLIETDVHRSGDGALVLVHDTTLARTTNAAEVFPGRGPWRVSDLTLAEIKRLDAGSWMSPAFAGEQVPTLEEVIRLVRGTATGLLVEVKAPSLHLGIEADLAWELDRFPSFAASAAAARRLVVQSFDWHFVRRYRQAQPEVPVGLLGAPRPSQLPELSLWADQVNPHHRSLDAAYVARVNQLGMDVLAWTVDEVADLNAALDRGVDGVITNRPGTLDEVLRDRLVRSA
jgi:glycerophosphoryl diester phosphodiesterase